MYTFEHPAEWRTCLSKDLVGSPEGCYSKCWVIAKPCRRAPLIGIEPSAILALARRMLDLVPPWFSACCRQLSAKLLNRGTWQEAWFTPAQFTEQKQEIKLHGHCYQRLSKRCWHLRKIYWLWKLYGELIPSGCCGMAGLWLRKSITVSMQIKELVLFPAVQQKLLPRVFNLGSRYQLPAPD